MSGRAADFGTCWLLIPCFNEASVIAGVIDEVAETFPNIVCVDDGSDDDSAAEIDRTCAHRLSHPVNLGQGAAIQTALEYARRRPEADTFVTFDADGQHQVKDVVAMIEKLRTEPLDVVIGTRFSDRSSRSVPIVKRVVLRSAVRLIPAYRRLGLSDAHNGLRVFNRKVADLVELKMSGMDHASEFVTLIESHGWCVAEHPVEILYTDYSRAKGQSIFNGINILVDGLLGRKGH